MKNNTMDNFSLTVVAREGLEEAMRFAFRGRKACGYSVLDGTLIFYWSKPDAIVPNYAPFPVGLTASNASMVAEGWLESTTKPDHPSFDGDVAPAWLLTTETEMNGFYTLAAVSFRWAIISK